MSAVFDVALAPEASSVAMMPQLQFADGSSPSNVPTANSFFDSHDVRALKHARLDESGDGGFIRRRSPTRPSAFEALVNAANSEFSQQQQKPIVSQVDSFTALSSESPSVLSPAFCPNPFMMPLNPGMTANAFTMLPLLPSNSMPLVYPGSYQQTSNDPSLHQQFNWGTSIPKSQQQDYPQNHQQFAAMASFIAAHTAASIFAGMQKLTGQVFPQVSTASFNYQSNGSVLFNSNFQSARNIELPQAPTPLNMLPPPTHLCNEPFSHLTITEIKDDDDEAFDDQDYQWNDESDDDFKPSSSMKRKRSSNKSALSSSCSSQQHNPFARGSARLYLSKNMQEKLGGRSPHKAVTYAALIAMAIYSMPNKRAKIRDIYKFIEGQSFVLQDGLPPNYKLSVRHNLSTRPCFIKTPDMDDLHQSSWWMVNEGLLPDAAHKAVLALSVSTAEATTVC
jgi:hypothetical protein